MTQLERIIELMKKNGGEVTCRELAENYLYHKAASRLGVEARRKGYQIVRRESHTESPMDAVYTLLDSPQNSVRTHKKADFDMDSDLFAEVYDKNQKEAFQEHGGCQ